MDKQEQGPCNAGQGREKGPIKRFRKRSSCGAASVDIIRMNKRGKKKGTEGPVSDTSIGTLRKGTELNHKLGGSRLLFYFKKSGSCGTLATMKLG